MFIPYINNKMTWYHCCSEFKILDFFFFLDRICLLFQEDLATAKKLSNEAYGSLKRVYIVCNDDMIIIKDYQRWMAENGEVNEIMEINGADHMPL